MAKCNNKYVTYCQVDLQGEAWLGALRVLDLISGSLGFSCNPFYPVSHTVFVLGCPEFKSLAELCK